MEIFSKKTHKVGDLNLHDFKFENLPFTYKIANVSALIDDNYVTPDMNLEDFIEKLMDTGRKLNPEQEYKFWRDPEGVIETGIETYNCYYPVGRTLRTVKTLNEQFDRKLLLLQEIAGMQKNHGEVVYRREHIIWFASDNTPLCDCCDNTCVEFPLAGSLAKTVAVSDFVFTSFASQAGLDEYEIPLETVQEIAQENTRQRLPKTVCVEKLSSGLHFIGSEILDQSKFILFSEYMNQLVEIVGGRFLFADRTGGGFYFANEENKKACDDLNKRLSENNKESKANGNVRLSQLYRWSGTKIEGLAHRR